MDNENERRTQIKSGEKFGIVGWWVNKDLTDARNPILVEDPEDKASHDNHRLIYVYFGKKKPTKDEMKVLIESTTIYIDDANY
jgi:hypothetical protein